MWRKTISTPTFAKEKVEKANIATWDIVQTHLVNGQVGQNVLQLVVLDFKIVQGDASLMDIIVLLIWVLWRKPSIVLTSLDAKVQSYEFVVDFQR